MSEKDIELGFAVNIYVFVMSFLFGAIFIFGSVSGGVFVGVGAGHILTGLGFCFLPIGLMADEENYNSAFSILSKLFFISSGMMLIPALYDGFSSPNVIYWVGVIVFNFIFGCYFDKISNTETK